MRPIEAPYFLELQSRLLEIFKYVSCHKDNFNTYSIKIENLFVNVCAFYDSLAQALIRHLHSEGHVFTSTVSDFTKKMDGDKEMNFKDYRYLLINEFDMKEMEINLNVYEEGYIPNAVRLPIEPIENFLFKPYGKVTSGGAQKWWRAFTKLKHDRLENIAHAKLKYLIDAMGATYILLTFKQKDAFVNATLPPEIFKVFYPSHMRKGGQVVRAFPKFHNDF